MLEIVLGVVAAALISMLIRFSMTVHRSRMENLRLHRDHFFERADRVVTNERADDAMLLRIKSMALDIDSPRAFATLNEVVAGMLKEMRSGKSPPMSAFPRPSEVEQELASVGFHYYLALSFLYPVRGWVFRNRIAQILEPGTFEAETTVIDRRMHVPLQPA